MPLGTAIVRRVGARPVNFAGILLMALGVFLLSAVDTKTNEVTMIADMMICGFGLGFSCQSLVSSVKYLPIEKSGIGSGIINAARQIGTCLGIALLVSVLNMNITDAKSNIVDSAIAHCAKHQY